MMVWRLMVVLAMISIVVPSWVGAAADSAGRDYDVISHAVVAPGGQRLALLKNSSSDGRAIVEIYTTDALAAQQVKRPYRVDANPMEIDSISWLSDQDLLLQLQYRVEDSNQDIYATRLAKLDVKAREIERFDQNLRVEHLLPQDPNQIIVSISGGRRSGPRVPRQFRPRSYHQFDLRKGTRKLIIRGKLSLGQIEFDGRGNPWLARGFDSGKQALVWYHRQPKAKQWREIFRLDQNSSERFKVVGFDHENRDILFVAATNGHNKVGLWEFDVRAAAFGELIYQRTDVDVAGVRYHSNSWSEPDVVAGVAYIKDRMYVEYFDAAEEAIYQQLESLIDYAHDLRITSRSRDGQTLTFVNQEPEDTGTFYMIHSGTLVKLGGSQERSKHSRGAGESLSE